ncbi:MAG: DUF2911 domain-containing protein [Longimicrobiales bacterium]
MPRHVLAAALLLALPATPLAAQETGAFVTLLGEDTVAIERFERTSDGLRIVTAVRVPRTRLVVYDVRLDDAGRATRIVATQHDPAAGPSSAALERATYAFENGGVRIEDTDDGEPRVRTAAAPMGALPFIEMIHWPFELAISRVDTDSVVVPMLGGTRVQEFRLERTGPRSFDLVHPFRGTMTVVTSGQGDIVSLDASQTTRKLRVERVADVDVAALAREYAARDARGEALGPLSGRGEDVGEIGGATIAVDYGRPAKRGRVIFGGLVPWGEVWRTGANEATHLTTDRDLVLGGTPVPAGRYTLFTIPEPDGWTLIVNRRVDIGGTSYDVEHDFARIPMRTRALDETVELFTIDVVAGAGAGAGELRLTWDTTEAWVPVEAPGS